MRSSQMLTVRITSEDLEKLDELAALQGRPRSQLVQEALAELIKNNENLRSIECARLKKQLRPAIKEQCAFLDKHTSFADDNRSF